MRLSIFPWWEVIPALLKDPAACFVSLVSTCVIVGQKFQDHSFKGLILGKKIVIKNVWTFCGSLSPVKIC